MQRPLDLAARHGGIRLVRLFSRRVSGQLDDTLRRLHLHYQEEGSRRLHAFSQWMPRLIYLGILLGIAYQVVRFWTGYYNDIFHQLNL